MKFEFGYAERQPDTPLVRVGDRLLPQRIDVVLPGDGSQPRFTARLEVVGGIPQCREIAIASVEGGREVKQLDLRGIGIAEMVEEVFALFATRVIFEGEGHITAVKEIGEKAHVETLRMIADARKGKGARKITPEFLAEVARVYKDNAGKSPTVAVQRSFNVSPRMAGNYIRRARDLGMLPEVTDGRRRT
ncbi:hypothetical protein [Nonomuraea cavernae]|uniref:Uncharacterized protein n=1 Tax=Nonomuraea cavernae TaxID=2045107 RepID=A0A917ZHJ9_9ACTN|nr:hypothetical protein [Nonomuraea cavernae]MCA2190961.1 hypothetical protein [Nonomuraea cavernae]GGO83450.1 hypothetical protein GCM10012289_76930 [Nonomuraea cavernae]